MAARRFAEDTEVPAGRTQGEIKDRLRAAGAVRTAIFEEPDGSSVAFQMGDGMYRITVPIPKGKDAAQEERRAWRLMNLLIKAKLEAIKEGATTVEREFMADRLLYNGRTVADVLGPELRIATEEGRMPTTLMLTAPR